MLLNRPESVEGVVLKSVAEVVKAAEEKNGPWPELEEPSFTSVPERSSFVERVILWLMAGLVGVVAIAAITRWDHELLLAILGVATTTLLGLAGLKNHIPGKKAYDQRSKRRKQKRKKPR